jgi:hypothetical protein
VVMLLPDVLALETGWSALERGLDSDQVRIPRGSVSLIVEWAPVLVQVHVKRNRRVQ